MKRIEYYRCEICGADYKKKEYAISCETGHAIDGHLNIIHSRHTPDFSRYGFPEKIILEIKGKSGCLAEYDLLREGPMEEFDLG